MNMWECGSIKVSVCEVMVVTQQRKKKEEEELWDPGWVLSQSVKGVSERSSRRGPRRNTHIMSIRLNSHTRQHNT